VCVWRFFFQGRISKTICLAGFKLQSSCSPSWVARITGGATGAWLVILLVFNFLSSLYILDINSLSDEYLAKIFSYSVGCLFTLLIVSFSAKFLISCNPICQFLLLFPSY
jgi:hypothetical protein